MEAKPVEMRLHFFNSAVIANSKLDPIFFPSMYGRVLQTLWSSQELLKVPIFDVRVFFIQKTWVILDRR